MVMGQGPSVTPASRWREVPLLAPAQSGSWDGSGVPPTSGLLGGTGRKEAGHGPLCVLRPAPSQLPGGGLLSWI